MFKIHELRELIKLIDQSSIQEFELEVEGSKLSMKKRGEEPVFITAQPQVQAPVALQQPTPTPQVVKEKVEPETKANASVVETVPAKVEDKNLHKINSPMVGTFYKAPAPDADPYVKVGDKVNEKTIVCIVEAMKLMNEIEAEVKGEIVEVLVENGQLVEYGQPLFLVKVE
ncbi:acetyl-CoA carboxylase biotin carboxyl carrier protein [Tepidibacillus infernus]|uniref:Biotin carboxyl carrier protein of acetyl-CoA carboxylase n=1 Tax=Tepidibacillus decaturensis TaxID=1413211 RepID=A0A135L315_9BACI|nr:MULTISPECIES: acetyl-CoA carboxylase biotin carboxyl carrier protein [Tepidibacillus]KXG43287.1 acetyl-CoA carboxylase biotin carboxyl carrier protein subunit [Tepidibacillus decaturensis]GBF11033.1 biotin carboxyl carrier protein of acetyl-CoA carboxylase [Tepidibacillus sp. HK-1]